MDLTHFAEPDRGVRTIRPSGRFRGVPWFVGMSGASRPKPSVSKFVWYGGDKSVRRGGCARCADPFDGLRVMLAEAPKSASEISYAVAGMRAKTSAESDGVSNSAISPNRHSAVNESQGECPREREVDDAVLRKKETWRDRRWPKSARPLMIGSDRGSALTRQAPRRQT